MSLPHASKTNLASTRASWACLLALASMMWLSPAAAVAAPCIAPNNGGTADLPALGCGLETRDGPLVIENGLPPATTIEVEIVELNLVCSAPIACSAPILFGTCEVPGGALGGDLQCYESALQLDLTGTGLLSGFSRNLFVPVVSETHSGPRTPGDPVQTFGTDFFRLEGQIFGDPDFDLLSIRWGTVFALPSPGSTTLTEIPGGDWNVDTFFDVEYMVDFQGAPGSVLDGMSGSTTKVAKVSLGESIAPPAPVPALSGMWAALLLAAMLAAASVWWLRRGIARS